MLIEPGRRVGLRLLPVVLLTSGLAVTFLSADAPQAPSASAESSPYRYCPVCGTQNRAENRFCLKDGTPLPPSDPDRRVQGFIRSPGTYSPEEIQRVMQRTSESVVRIRVRTKTTYKYPIAYWKDEEAQHYKRAMLGKIETSESDARFAGSGFVISQDGEIVTNAHVASPDGMQADLTIETHDGRSFPARLIGADAASDLALLKIDTTTIPPLAWGDSSAIRVGQETWAIGNPLNIGISITRSEEHTSELQSLAYLVCRLLLEKKKSSSSSSSVRSF